MTLRTWTQDTRRIGPKRREWLIRTLCEPRLTTLEMGPEKWKKDRIIEKKNPIFEVQVERSALLTGGNYSNSNLWSGPHTFRGFPNQTSPQLLINQVEMMRGRRQVIVIISDNRWLFRCEIIASLSCSSYSPNWKHTGKRRQEKSETGSIKYWWDASQCSWRKLRKSGMSKHHPLDGRSLW